MWLVAKCRGEMHSTYVVVLDEFPTTANGQAEAAEYALTLRHVGVLAIALLDIYVEGLALEEDLQVGVVL